METLKQVQGDENLNKRNKKAEHSCSAFSFIIVLMESTFHKFFQGFYHIIDLLFSIISRK